MITVHFLLQFVDHTDTYHVKSINEMNDEAQEPNDCKQQLGRQQMREQAEQDFPVMREIQRVRSYVGLEKQARNHISSSKPNYRDMPAVSTSKNHGTESSKCLY